MKRRSMVVAPFALVLAFSSVAAAQMQTAAPTNVMSAPAIAAAAADAAQTAAPKPAFEYSDGYRTRAKIHKIGSIAMVPLLATQGFLGASIYKDPTPEKKDWHRRVAWGIGGLFAANTVTGAWNLIEGRKDPEKRKLRTIHGILMLAADAGFLATAAMRPDTSQPDFVGQKSTHRAVAFTSVGVATVGYALMLFGHR